MTFKDKPRRPGDKPTDRDSAHGSAPKARPEGAAPKPRASSGGSDLVKAERISKIMARAGVASRRDVERMIMEGRVRLNGVQLETPVVNATLADHIEVDGVAIRGIERTRLWLYHKPAGLVTTNADPEGRDTVFDNLPGELPRVMSIGRLDINTEGLLLLTNDGGLARVLELPSTGWLRRYRVRAYGAIEQAALDKLKEGIAVDGVLYGAIDATLDKVQGHNVWITMGLREGKNREIKNVMGALGLEVNRLIRISYGPFQLGDLPEGDVVEVRGRMLRDQLGPRLIEDANANFDAPLYDAAAIDETDNAAPAAAPQRPQRSAWEKPEDKRERALGRLDTRDGRRDDGKGRGGRDKPGDDRRPLSPEDRPKRRPIGAPRTSSVWMAPGARPVAEKSAVKPVDGEAKPMRARADGKPAGKRFGRTKDGLPTKGAKRHNPDRRPGGPEIYDPGPRVVVQRAPDDSDWIRADGPDKPAGGDKGFGRKGPSADRGERSFGGAREERPRSDRPREDRPREDRPRGDRPFGDKPRGDRPFGDKPRSDRPFGDKPRGEKSFGDRPRGDKPYGDKPRGDRPFGDKPRGPRGADDRPAGARSFGDKPYRGREEGDRPAGSRPAGDRPARPANSRPPSTRSDTARPAGGKPAYGKPSSGKPAGAKPYTGKPRSDRPDGGKPSGPRGGKGRG
ncbi:MAG: pseudouridine synthase [Allorhizobium sp.]